MTAAKLIELVDAVNRKNIDSQEWHEARFNFQAYMSRHAQDFIKLMEAAELMAEVSDENCRFDYDGYCQSHNIDHQMDGCRVAKLRQALAAFKEKS